MTQNWLHPMPTPQAFRINRILYDVQHDRDEEAAYFADPAAYVARFPHISIEASDALKGNDIGALYKLGVNPYLLRSYCLQLRVPEKDYLAALRAVGDPDHG